ncbi:unnamed protein product [Prorocentrum cordatum]|uniref:CSD domain-containing protein n=1 Tax=Prorocentrum cordatum TaxID=2364126 RepID=A0ABN9UBB3_9DINO|nr:unnamed protein product [Polarella glacialis]
MAAPPQLVYSVPPVPQVTAVPRVVTARPRLAPEVPQGAAAGRRYEGTINQFRAEKGFGFIRCEELRQGAFPEKDVFLHRLQILNFKEGDQVSFTLIRLLNKDGKPQATQLGLPGQGPAAVKAQPSVQFVQQAAFGAPVVARPANPPPPAPPLAAVPRVPAAAAEARRGSTCPWMSFRSCWAQSS